MESRLREHNEKVLGYQNRVLAERTNNPSLWVANAKTLERLGRLEDALVSYERAIALAPTRAYIWTMAGQLLEKLGRGDEAAVALKRGREIARIQARKTATRGEGAKRGDVPKDLISHRRAPREVPEPT